MNKADQPSSTGEVRSSARTKMQQIETKRHFFQYERYEAVRSKEMVEARVDAVFASLREDPQFLALTGAADGKLPIPQNNKMPVAAPAKM
jgi:hypothetical protein